MLSSPAAEVRIVGQKEDLVVYERMTNSVIDFARKFVRIWKGIDEETA